MRSLIQISLALWGAAQIGAAGEIAVDFAQTNGAIRALHGVNLGPLCYRGTVDLSDYHRQIGAPLTRLHDVVWVNYDAVDISTIFREFRNDPARPDSYEFAATDDYLAATLKAGSQVVYRLGESIEHTPRKYRVHPPRDFAKWAEVCCGIVRHYNEGWASGFHHNIQYWEIWNEPENQPAMWTGTDDQFFQLYETAAKLIKSRWPGLKVGGPALGYTGEFQGGTFKAGKFFLQFLSHCRDRRVPLDFFSWHRYAGDPSEYARRARAVRQVLDDHGFTRTESHCNEWNFLPNEDWRPMMREGQGLTRDKWCDEMTGPKGAAFAAWALVSMQDAPVDVANFYTAEVQAFGMFSLHGAPRKNFHAFRAFRALLDTPCRVRTAPCEPGRVAACAGLDASASRAGVLLSNFNTPGTGFDLACRGLPWTGSVAFELCLVDATHDFVPVRRGLLGADGRLSVPELKAPAVALVRLFPQAGIPSR